MKHCLFFYEHMLHEAVIGEGCQHAAAGQGDALEELLHTRHSLCVKGLGIGVHQAALAHDEIGDLACAQAGVPDALLLVLALAHIKLTGQHAAAYGLLAVPGLEPVVQLMAELHALDDPGSMGLLGSVRPKSMPNAKMPPFNAPHMQPERPAPTDMPEDMAMTASGTSSSKFFFMAAMTASQQK